MGWGELCLLRTMTIKSNRQRIFCNSAFTALLKALKVCMIAYM